jgi:hypothetical protein
VSFLAPLYLLLGAAAAVPLLLHLLRRRIGTTVEFPATRYLERAEQEHSAKLRLRNWLLMALRVLAVLLVAVAAARPVGRLGAGGHPPTALAVVLDNSLSTSAVVDGGPLLDRLRDEATRVLADAGPADRVWLVTADGRVSGGSASAVRAAVSRAEPLAGAGDLRAAVERGAELARGARLAASVVVVVSDGQATAWAAPADVGTTRTLLVAPPAGAPPANRSVVAAAARPVRWTPAGAVLAQIAGRDSATYRLTLTDRGGVGRTLARGTAAPGAEVVIRAQPAERGWLAGAVAVEPDELRGDDVRHFAVYVGGAPVVRADPSAGPFVSSAIATLAESRRVTPGERGAAAVAAAAAGVRLPAFLTAPEDPAALGAANQALERAGVPWRFGPARIGDAPVRFRGDSAEAAAGGAPVTASRRYALQPRGRAPADTLATAGGEPWIVAGEGYVLVASPLVPEATTFPVRAGFLPWLADVLAQRLGGSVGHVTAAAPGARVATPSGVDALEGPGGRREPVRGTVHSAPLRPGTYFWLRNGARAGALEVNPEAEESRLERLDERALRGRVRGAEVAVVARGGALADAAWRGEGRRPIGGPMLVAALVTLAAESLAARRVGHARR